MEVAVEGVTAPHRLAPAMPPLIDTHCHLHDDSEACGAGLVDGKEPLLPSSTVGAAFLMSVSQDDWQQVQRVCDLSARLRPFFGVHPWHAHRVAPGWQRRLADQLRRHPHAGVGEIGLDFAATTLETGRCEKEAQVSVFREQLRIAHELQRPVSVHCVRSHGRVFDILRELGEQVPPAIAFHSFGGALEMAVSFMKLPKKVGRRIFFGFSICINRRSPKFSSVVKAIPSDRLLVESDWPSPVELPSLLAQACEAFAAAKGGPGVGELAVTCNANAERFVASLPSVPPPAAHS